MALQIANPVVVGKVERLVKATSALANACAGWPAWITSSSAHVACANFPEKAAIA